MNRIRISNNKYQVLKTPNLQNASFETLYSNWNDEHIMHFYINEYDNDDDAMFDALNDIDIDWHKIVSSHQECFNKIKKNIESIIESNKITTELESNIAKPNILKHVIFEKTLNNDTDMIYNINEIISFKVVNPWTKNLLHFANIFINNDSLHIYDIKKKNNKLYLLGHTEIGTTYEIIFQSTLINYFCKWFQNNKSNKKVLETANNIYMNIIKLQKMIDTTSNLL